MIRSELDSSYFVGSNGMQTDLKLAHTKNEYMFYHPLGAENKHTLIFPHAQSQIINKRTWYSDPNLMKALEAFYIIP